MFVIYRAMNRAITLSWNIFASRAISSLVSSILSPSLITSWEVLINSNTSLEMSSTDSKHIQKKFSHQKTFYLAQMNGGLEKKFFENIASKASEKFSNFRK